MSDVALDPEAGAVVEDEFCAAVNGLGPHDYRPVIDILGGSGIWLFCAQCGDHFNIDGTALPQGTSLTPPPPSATPGAAPTPWP